MKPLNHAQTRNQNHQQVGRMRAPPRKFSTETAAQFSSEVWVTRKQRRVNGKSIMGLTTLAAAQGATIELETEGYRRAAAMQALADLINDYFGGRRNHEHRVTRLHRRQGHCHWPLPTSFCAV